MDCSLKLILAFNARGLVWFAEERFAQKERTAEAVLFNLHSA
jgi:predicted membrane protein